MGSPGPCWDASSRKQAPGLALERPRFTQQMRTWEFSLDKARLCLWASLLLAGAGRGMNLQSLGLIPGALQSTSFLRLVVTVLISSAAVAIRHDHVGSVPAGRTVGRPEQAPGHQALPDALRLNWVADPEPGGQTCLLPSSGVLGAKPLPHCAPDGENEARPHGNISSREPGALGRGWEPSARCQGLCQAFPVPELHLCLPSSHPAGPCPRPAGG